MSSSALTAVYVLVGYVLVLGPVVVACLGIVIYRRRGHIEPVNLRWPIALWGATSGAGMGFVLAWFFGLSWLLTPALAALIGLSLWGWTNHYQRLYERRLATRQEGSAPASRSSKGSHFH